VVYSKRAPPLLSDVRFCSGSNEADEEIQWYQHEICSHIAYAGVTFSYFLVGALIFCEKETITIDCGEAPKQIVVYGVNQTQIQFYFSSTDIHSGLRGQVLDGVAALSMGGYSAEQMECSRRPTFVEGLYWGAATLTGVGYGDLSPSTNVMKEFTIVYIVFGFGVVLTILTISASALLTKVQRYLLMKLDDDPFDDRQPHCWKIILSLLLVAFVCMLGAVFFSYEEGWAYSDAIYFTVVTSTCVGYGDMVPTTQASKLFSFFYMLISSSFVLFGLSNLGNILNDVDLERRRREVLNRQVNVEMILAQDLSGDSKVSEGEYLAGFLEEVQHY
jgi:voltage-gated potassium channel Kch